MSSFDVAIIGGGIIGASIAFELASEKLRVVVFDRQQPGREASWAAAGMLSPSPHSSRDIPLVPFARASLAMYPSFIAAVEESSGVKTNYRRIGTLHLFNESEGAQERDRTIQENRALQLAAEQVPMEKAREMERSISSSVAAAAWLPDEATVEPRLLIQAALGAAYGRGVEVRASCAVTSLCFSSANSGSRFPARHSPRCVGVIANGERVLANHVIVAAGCFCDALAPAHSPSTGDEQMLTTALLSRYAPVVPVRGQMLALQPPKPLLHHILRSNRGYLVPRLDGRVIAGSTIEYAGFEKSVTAAGMRQIIEAAIELAPDLAEATVVETWAGLRPGTPDDLPIVGPCEIDGLFFATGHYRNGILLAPVTAQIVKDWIAHRKSGDNAALSPSRFAPPAVQTQSAP